MKNLFVLFCFVLLYSPILGKPQMQAYVLMFEMVLKKFPGAKPENCVFFDDAKVNLKTAKEFGFKTGNQVLQHDLC